MSDNKDNSQEIMISDEQLDDWLAQVDVPAGLHDDLLKISDLEKDVETENESVSPKTFGASSPYAAESYGYRWTGLAVAVCYFVLAGSIWVFWPTDQVAEQQVQSAKNEEQADRARADAETASRKPPTKNKSTVEKSTSSSLANAKGMTDFGTALQSIDEKLNELKIRELEEKLAKIENETLRLESSESASIVLAIADQTPIHLGASRESIQSDMTKVVAEFPDSRGAAIASQLIYQPNW